MLAPIAPTLDITYALQLRWPDGTWHFHSQAEYTTADDVREYGAQIYGGTVEFRVVKIVREVLD